MDLKFYSFCSAIVFHNNDVIKWFATKIELCFGIESDQQNLFYYYCKKSEFYYCVMQVLKLLFSERCLHS